MNKKSKEYIAKKEMEGYEKRINEKTDELEEKKYKADEIVQVS